MSKRLETRIADLENREAEGRGKSGIVVIVLDGGSCDPKTFDWATLGGQPDNIFVLPDNKRPKPDGSARYDPESVSGLSLREITAQQSFYYRHGDPGLWYRTLP